MTEKHLHVLQHALGVDEFGQGPAYRNFFCAGGGDETLCRELIALGFMKQHATTEWLPYFNCSVTDAGKAAVVDESPKPPKLSRSKQRYLTFLREDCGHSFGEWLRWQKARRTDSSQTPANAFMTLEDLCK